MECMKGMFADVLEQTLQAEIDQHLGYDRAERTTCEGKKNYRNGSVKRTMKTQLGEVDVNVPRDRNGEFEPQIIGKYQRNASFPCMLLECPQEISETRSKDCTM